MAYDNVYEVIQYLIKFYTNIHDVAENQQEVIINCHIPKGKLIYYKWEGVA